MLRAFKYGIVAVAVIALLGLGAWIATRLRSSDDVKIDVAAARVSDIRSMAELCTVELYNEVPVKDTVNNKVIFAIQKQRGSVSFDLGSLEIDTSGDTVRAVLPRERVEIYEATDPDSWQVIDTKNIGFLGALRSDRLSDAEESQVKDKLRRTSVARLYSNGTVARARREASRNLESMLEKVYRRPARVTAD